ncbi:uncharacterized protein LOC121978015 [Zingiber officinale]|uniref:Uncharacterized protein n=1 Tax=Zingiber officinale TaxID=94328 RepID=A0A8J5GYR6_ZINOF|nr:uncharacterized protein LOC121978015 [Zingiber officinale]KAG6512761.1 hypothetical protein ZIOFF_030890 [Zingiber officinale]
MAIIPHAEGYLPSIGSDTCSPVPSGVSPPPPSRKLHNFIFPTRSWGNQRHLRCTNLPFAGREDTGATLTLSFDRIGRTTGRCPPSSHLEKTSPASTKGKANEGAERTLSSSVPDAERPWNLRKRRAACNAPAEDGCPTTAPGSSAPLLADKSSPLGDAARGSSDAAEMEKFSIVLSREEIEQDYLAFKGTKPPRRPKKRSKIVQRQLDYGFPGLWLSEITPETYKVDD